MKLDIKPALCAAAGCSRKGEALLERYEPEDESPTALYRPSGDWIWLCPEHTIEEFS